MVKHYTSWKWTYCGIRIEERSRKTADIKKVTCKRCQKAIMVPFRDAVHRDYADYMRSFKKMEKIAAYWK